MRRALVLAPLCLGMSACASSTERTAASTSLPASTKPSTTKKPTTTTKAPPPSTSTTVARDGTNFRFGETAPYEGYGGRSGGRSLPKVPLEITVTGPTPFKASKNAKVYGDFGNDVEPLASSIYVTVTIRNTSTTAGYEADFVHTKVTSPEAYSLSDGDISGIEGDPVIGPGKAITFKDGFSVAAGVVKYEIHLDGVQGKTFNFTS